MGDPMLELLRGVLASNNDVDVATALFGAGANREQQELAERVGQYAFDEGLLYSTGPDGLGVDFIRVGVTPAGEQYLAEHS